MEMVIIWVFAAIVMVFCAIVSAMIAHDKGRSGVAWFFLGAFFGPFAFSVALLPDLKERKKPGIEDMLLRKCPFCAEMIKQEAVKCRFCASEIPANSQTQTEQGPGPKREPST